VDTVETATDDGDTKQLQAAAHIQSKSHELDLFCSLFRLQQKAMGSKGKVRDGLRLRGYLCGGSQGCELWPHGVHPETGPIDPQEMSQHTAMHDRMRKGTIKMRGNQGGRPPLDLHTE
jgi:hypothetical protein